MDKQVADNIIESLVEFLGSRESDGFQEKIRYLDSVLMEKLRCGIVKNSTKEEFAKTLEDVKNALNRVYQGKIKRTRIRSEGAVSYLEEID